MTRGYVGVAKFGDTVIVALDRDGRLATAPTQGLALENICRVVDMLGDSGSVDLRGAFDD